MKEKFLLGVKSSLSDRSASDGKMDLLATLHPAAYVTYKMPEKAWMCKRIAVDLLCQALPSQPFVQVQPYTKN